MSGKYEAGLRAIMRAEINLVSADIRVQLIDEADYTVNLATHEDMADVAAAAKVGSPAALTGKTVSGAGVFSADDTSLTGLSGDPIEALIIFLNTGTASTDTTICYINGLSLTIPANGEVDILWNASGIFALG